MKRAREMFIASVALAALAATSLAARVVNAEPALLPLPDAPVRLVIPDAAAFDAALAGSFRSAAEGELDPNDPLLSAWRQSPVGSKLEAEWSKLASDLPWTWTQLRRLQPRSLGVALLSAGALEAVMAVDTPLATLPLAPPAGQPRTHAGIGYSVVAAGSADPEGGDARRAGLAWTRHRGLLLVATSERALKLALEELAAGRGVTAFLPGIASLELDLDRLREDRYFAREFVFGSSRDEGRVRAALRVEDGDIVEQREGRGPRADSAFLFDAASAAAGWEPEADGLWRAVRAGLLEPSPGLLERPLAPLRPLPSASAEPSDSYLVRLDRPRAEAAATWDEGDVASWRDLLAGRPSAGWGWLVGGGGERAVVFAWPRARQDELERACRATIARRAGIVREARVGDALELRVGPGLVALAVRRAGEFVWLGSSATAVSSLTAPRAAADLVRWGRVDLAAVRGEAERWARAEGPAAPERVRPFSDRVLGLLGWLPSVRTIAVERRQHEGGWTERVRFGTR